MSRIQLDNISESTTLAGNVNTAIPGTGRRCNLVQIINSIFCTTCEITLDRKTKKVFIKLMFKIVVGLRKRRTISQYIAWFWEPEDSLWLSIVEPYGDAEIRRAFQISIKFPFRTS